MKNEHRVFRHVFLAMMVAVGVVISPILRVRVCVRWRTLSILQWQC